MTTIIGSGGGGGSKNPGGSSRSPRTTPDSLDSRQYATVVDLISEGEIEGLVDGNKGIFLNGTALQNAQGGFNFEDVTVYTRNGTQAQTFIPITSGSENIRAINRGVVKDGPVTESIVDDEVDAVRVTVTVPSLQRINNETGDTTGTKIELKILVKYQSDSDFAVLIEDKISGRTADKYQKDYLITLNRPDSADNVDIRVERVTKDSNSSLLSNAFSWSSLTEIKYAKLRYPQQRTGRIAC